MFSVEMKPRNKYILMKKRDTVGRSFKKIFTLVTRIFPKLGLRKGIVRHKVEYIFPGSCKDNGVTLISSAINFMKH